MIYQTFFNFSKNPFSITPDTDIYCQTWGHEATLASIDLALKNSENIIKIIGEIGCGKTLLCRLLLEKFQNIYTTCYILNPMLSPRGLLKTIARELGIVRNKAHKVDEWVVILNDKLLDFYSKKEKVVILVDECQAMPIETLEALRLLTNLETRHEKLVTLILFGQPDFDKKLKQRQTSQVTQRISTSLYLKGLSFKEMEHYIVYRLVKAGCGNGQVFSLFSKWLLFKASRGIPRVINILCHKSLLLAYSQGVNKISFSIMRKSVIDYEATCGLYHWFLKSSSLRWLSFSGFIACLFYMMSNQSYFLIRHFIRRVLS